MKNWTFQISCYPAFHFAGAHLKRSFASKIYLSTFPSTFFFFRKLIFLSHPTNTRNSFRLITASSLLFCSKVPAINDIHVLLRNSCLTVVRIHISSVNIMNCIFSCAAIDPLTLKNCEK